MRWWRPARFAPSADVDICRSTHLKTLKFLSEKYCDAIIEVVAVLSAMKMEMAVQAPMGGKVTRCQI